MKDSLFDTNLIASAPAGGLVDSDFTDRVMRRIYIINIAKEPVPDESEAKPSLLRRLQYLPRFAVILLVIALLTTLGGTAYAIYKAIWDDPGISVSEQAKNQHGRAQLNASLANCGDQQSETRFEVKSGNTLDSSEISKILRAYCEKKAISEWAGETVPQINAGKTPNIGTSQSSMTMLYPAAVEVESIDGQSLRLIGDRLSPEESLELTNGTQYIADGQYVTRDQISKGDTILFIQTLTTTDVTTQNELGEYVTSGTPVSNKIDYIIKVSLPYPYYNTKQDLITERQSCMGNTDESCVQAQAIDVYSGSPGVTSNEQRRIVQGIITSHNDTTMKIESSSGKEITLVTPTDIVTEFNQKKAPLYGGVKVEAGDLLQVRYIVGRNSSGLELSPSNIESIQLLIDAPKRGQDVDKY